MLSHPFHDETVKWTGHPAMRWEAIRLRGFLSGRVDGHCAAEGWKDQETHSVELPSRRRRPRGRSCARVHAGAGDVNAEQMNCNEGEADDEAGKAAWEQLSGWRRDHDDEKHRLRKNS